MTTKPTPQQIASLFGCTEQQVVSQQQKNRRQLASMAARAKATGRRVNGYTHEQLMRLAK